MVELNSAPNNSNFSSRTYQEDFSDKMSVEPVKRKSIFKRYRWLILALISILIVVAIVLIVLFVVIFPNAEKISSINDNQIKNKKSGLVEKPDLSKLPKDFKYDDDRVANSYSPNLKEKFDFTKKKIRGVNLGGWLVPEPFIVPSIYSKYISEGVVDEYTLCKLIGKPKCTELLLQHYNNFVTEDEVKLLADSGLNHIRIPFGYWSIDNTEDEPFVYGAWEYLLRGIEWCRKYGLRVMIDFHAAPGSQNGWNHSGRVGEIRFLNTTNPQSQANVDRFLDILTDVVKYFSRDEYKNVVTQIGVLNEPAVFLTKNQQGTLEFYKDAYTRARELTKNDSPTLVFHEGFLGLDKWKNTLPSPQFTNVVLDSHNYIIFDENLILKPKSELLDFPCSTWSPMFAKSQKDFGPTMCGEFSLATNDCGKWLNGINLGTRYEGTYERTSPVCDTCTCKGVDDYKNWDQEYKQFLLQFSTNQMDAFENGVGWYFWNFKTEEHINPHWDYLLGLEEGWIPKDVSKRTLGCTKNSTTS